MSTEAVTVSEADRFDVDKGGSFYLSRFVHFGQIILEEESYAIPSNRRLARYAFRSAYRDCIASNLEAEAKALMRTIAINCKSNQPSVQSSLEAVVDIQPDSTPNTTDQMVDLFSGRLARLVDTRQRANSIEHLAKDDWRRRLIDKAMYSTYQDLVRLGREDSARKLTEQ